MALMTVKGLSTYGLAHIVDDPSPFFPTLAVSRAGEVVRSL